MTEIATLEKINIHETYARSLSGIRMLGEVALAGYAPEQQAKAALERTWNDFYTGVEENIATDSEYGEELIFNPVKSWNIQNGSVCSEYGTPMVELVRQGFDASERATVENPEMAIQAERDKGDVMVAELVDELKPGEFLGVVSLDPKTAIKKNRDFWENEMGYRDGMAVFQGYFRSSDNELLTTTVAIKRSNKKALASILQSNGSTVQEETDDSHWTRHPVQLAGLTEEQAISFGENIRLKHRELIEDKTAEYSTTEFMESHEQTLLNYFDMYMRPLAEATYEAKNNLTMQQLAQNIQLHVSNLAPNIRSQLIKIANSRRFDDDDARLMESMIRYSVVEDLRRELPRYMSRAEKKSESNNTDSIHIISPSIVYNAVVNEIYQANMTRQLALNINSGASAGRTYGGCSSGRVDTRAVDNVDDGSFGLQDVYGGAKEDSENDTTDEDDLGPRKFTCSKGHENYRKVRNKPEKNCGTCGEDVSCGMD